MTTATISFIPEPAYHWEPFLLFGEGFTGSSAVYIWDEVSSGDVDKLLADRVKNGSPKPSPLPPNDGRTTTTGAWTSTLSSQVIGVVPAGNTPNVVWVSNDKGVTYSAPYVVNTPKLYFVEFGGALSAGQEARVFGRNLCANHGTAKPRLWLVSASDPGKVYPLVWATAYDYQQHYISLLVYELRFRVPQDVPAGDYQLWVHCGSGDSYGFAEPLPVKIVAKAPAASLMVNVMDYGARGDGLADDTKAIQAAHDALASRSPKASETGLGTLFFPTGTYQLSSCLKLAAGVTLRGAGPQLSCLRPHPDYTAASLPATDALLSVPSDCRVCDMAIRGNSRTPAAVIITNDARQVENIVITNCDISNPYAPLMDAAYMLGTAIYVQAGAVNVEISHCALSAMIGIYPGGAPYRYCRTMHNTYNGCPKLSGLTATSEMGWIVGDRCIVEGNLCQFSNRGFTCGPWQGVVSHNFIARNMVLNGEFQNGQGESYLFEIAQAVVGGWLGSPASADANTLSQNDVKWTPNGVVGYQVLVVGGTGFGQYRTVVANTETAVTLDRPWNVAPDATSKVFVNVFGFENLIIANHSRFTMGGLDVGGALGTIVDGHELLHSQYGIWLSGNNCYLPGEQFFAYGPVAHNHIRNCNIKHSGSLQEGLYGQCRFNGLRLYAQRYEQTPHNLVCFGNSFVNNRWDHSGIGLDEVVYDMQSGTYLQPNDPSRKKLPACVAYNALCSSGDVFDGQDDGIPDIAIGPGVGQTFLFLWNYPHGPFVPGGKTAVVDDKGGGTVIVG